MKIPKIKIDVDSGEADIVNWEEFDKMNSYWRFDVAFDLKRIIDKKYENAKNELFEDGLEELRKMGIPIKTSKLEIPNG